MALKVLSGVLVVNEEARSGGSATVSFTDNRVSGDAVMHHRAMIGGAERFREKPCRITTMREFTIQEDAEKRPSNFSNLGDPQDEVERETIVLDTSCTEDTPFVKWRGHDSSLGAKPEVREISFLVIGET